MDEFKNSDDLKVWLVTKGLSETMAQTASGSLWEAGFVAPGTLIGISASDLRPPLNVPISMAVSNAVKAPTASEGPELVPAYEKFKGVLVDQQRQEKFLKMVGHDGVLAVQALNIRSSNAAELFEFAEKVLAHPGSRTRQYFADQNVLCDGTVVFGPVTFMRAFKAGSSVPMLIKIGAKKIEMDAYTRVVSELRKSNEKLPHPLPGLVSCEVVVVKEQPYLAMPNYIASLDDLPRHHLMAPAVLKIAETVKGALDLLHLAGAYHCDIKPANIFLDSYGNAFLGDYGSIIFIDDNTQASPLATEEYVPHEVLIRKPSPWFDYALLAVTLADLLCLFEPGKKKMSLYDESIKLPDDPIYDTIWKKAKEMFPCRTQPPVQAESLFESEGSVQNLSPLF